MKKFWNSICAFFSIIRALVSPFNNSGNRQIFVFILFLLISTMFWFLQSLNNKGRADVRIPIQYTDVPQDLLITNFPVEYVEVELQDKGINLISYALGRTKPVELNVSHYKINNGKLVVSKDILNSIIDDRIKSTTEVIDLSCDSVVLLFAPKEGVKLPIQLNANISVASNYISKDAPEIIPSEVTVYADTSIISRLKYVETEYTSALNLNDTTEILFKIKPIEGAMIEPSEIKVIVPVEELILKRLSLPVKTKNVPSSISIITFPATAEVEFLVPLSLFPHANETDFKIEVDYRGFDPAIKKMPVIVSEYPDFVSQLAVSPDSIEYIIQRRIVPELTDSEE